MQAYANRTGWIMLAAIVMFAVGFFRIISGISYLASSHRVNLYTGNLFGGQLWVWGIWDLVIAGLAIWAAYSLLGGGEYGRIATYVWAVLVIVNSFVQIDYSPWFAVAMITLAVFVIYGLASTPLDRTELATPDRGMGT